MLEKMHQQLSDLYPEMVELRRHFHMNPEISFHEEKTPLFIADYLRNLGIEVRTEVGGRGVVGIIKGGQPGKTVALRADFDALPIQDEKDVEYKSQVPGAMHACAHDAHTATLLAVAKVLVQYKEELHGNIVLIHQFAEEITPGGAISMVADGCLDQVDAIFGTHIWSPMPVGQIGYRTGPMMAAADRFTLKVQGKGGHGATPHETVDSIAVSAALISNLQQIISRRIDPLQPAVLTIGELHAGDAFNVIADSATMTGTVRTFDKGVQDSIIENMENIIKAECEAAGATYTLDYERGYPAVSNHAAETKLLVDNAVKVVGAEQVKEIEPLMVAEDFSYYLQKVPGTFFLTGAGNTEKGITYPHHHPMFDIDEQAMLIAAKTLLSVALDYLQK